MMQPRHFSRTYFALVTLLRYILTTMEPEKTKGQIPPEIQEQANNLIRDAFRLMHDHNRKMAEDMADFERRRQEIRQRRKNGARQNSGHIV
jgi:hypothetical protein